MKRFIIILAAVVTVFFSFGFTTNDALDKTRTLQIVMYHSILRTGTGRYVISPETLDADIKKLKSDGFQTVTVDELLQFVNGTGTLPAHPLLLSFDDGFYNNAYYAEKVLINNDCHAVLNVVGKFTDDTIKRGEQDHPHYAYLTWDEIGKLSKNGVFEIGNHTYDMHAYSPRFGTGRLPDESDNDYRTALTQDIAKQQQKLQKATAQKPRCFAYPFGKVNGFARKTVENMGFVLTMTCKEDANTIRRGDPGCLLHLSRYNREPSGVPALNLPAVPSAK